MSLDEFLSECPECGAMDKIKDDKRGEVICTNCGLVLKEKIEVDQQRRVFHNDERKDRRHNEPIKKGYHLVIKDYQDFTGKPLKPEMIWRFRRLSKINNTYCTSKERAAKTINHIMQKIELPSEVKYDAERMMEKIIEKKLTKGRSYDVMLTASIYLSSLINKKPMFLSDIIEGMSTATGDISKRFTYKGIKLIMQENVLQDLGYLKAGEQLPKPQLKDYIRTYCQRIKMPEDLIQKALKLGRLLNSNGKNPASVIAGIIYGLFTVYDPPQIVIDSLNKITGYDCKYVTQSLIATYMKKTEVSVRNRYKEITKFLKQI